MLYKFSYERLRSQASVSARRDQAIELRAATEGKTVAAFLISLMASDQEHCTSYSFFCRDCWNLLQFDLKLSSFVLHLLDNLIKRHTASINHKNELEKSNCII